jgi:hypothetical protein
MGRRSRVVLVLAAWVGSGCSRQAPGPSAVRLVDAFDAKRVEGSTGVGPARAPRTEWRFDGTPPSPAPAAFADTRGFEAGPGVESLAVRDGLLVGRATTDHPILHVQRTRGLDDGDQLHAVEIRLRVSAGANLSLVTRPGETVDLPQELAQARSLPWTTRTPVLAGPEPQTYTITPPAPVSSGRIRHLLIRPTDVPGGEFAIESVRWFSGASTWPGSPRG